MNDMRFDSAFFEKHQERLLHVANSPLLRWVLGLNRKAFKQFHNVRITGIAPNAIQFQTNKASNQFQTKREVAYYARPFFAETLAFNLSPFSMMVGQKKAQFRFSPVGALGMIALWAMIRKGSDTPLWLIPIFGTTYSFNTSTGEGLVQHYNNTNSWSTAHGATDGTSASTSMAGGLSIGYCRILGGSYNVGIHRYFFPFDTTVLSGTPSSAKLFLYCNSTTTGATSPCSSDSVIVGPTSQASNTALAVGDFDQCGSVSNPTEVSSVFTPTSFTTGMYNAIPLTSMTPISDSGYTKLGIRQHPNDCLNSDPGAGVAQHDASYANVDSNDDTNPPYLLVTYDDTEVKIYNISQWKAATGTSLTIPLTTGGTNRGAIAFVMDGTGGSSVVTGVTCGGTAMTKLSEVQVPSGNWITVWFLANPSSGSAPIVISTSSSVLVAAIAAALETVKQTGQPDSSDTSTATGTSIDTDVTTTADKCLVITMTKAGSGASSRTITCSDPTIGLHEGYSIGIFGGEKTPAGARTTTTNTSGASTGLGSISVSIAPYVPTIASTIQLKARVKILGNASTVQLKSRVKQLGIATTIQTKTRVKKLGVASSLQMRARISSGANISMKGRIKQLGVASTLTSKGRIKKTFAPGFPYCFRITPDAINGDLMYDLSLAPEGRTITVDGEEIYVPSLWEAARSDGGDIRVTLQDGITPVAREVSGFDFSGHKGSLYLATGGGTAFYVYYGNPSATEPAANSTYGSQAVWNSNWGYVGHMDVDGRDSTANANNGTDLNTSIVAGGIGNAERYSGGYTNASRTTILDNAALKPTDKIGIFLMVKSNKSQMTGKYYDASTLGYTGFGSIVNVGGNNYIKSSAGGGVGTMFSYTIPNNEAGSRSFRPRGYASSANLSGKGYFRVVDAVTGEVIVNNAGFSGAGVPTSPSTSGQLGFIVANVNANDLIVTVVVTSDTYDIWMNNFEVEMSGRDGYYSKNNLCICPDGGNNFRFQTRIGGVNSSAITTGVGITPGTWYRVWAWYDGARRKIYVNGVLKYDAAITGALESATGNVAIGENAAFSSARALADISEVRMCNVPPDATYIANMEANLSSPSTFWSTGEVEYFRLGLNIKARIQKTESDIIQMKAAVKNVVVRLVQMKAAVKQSDVAKSIQLKSRIRHTEAFIIQTLARIKKTETAIIQMKAAVKQSDVAKSIQIKSRLQRIESSTIQLKAAIKYFGITGTMLTKARIKRLGVSTTLQMKARLVDEASGFVTMKSYDQDWQKTLISNDPQTMRSNDQNYQKTLSDNRIL